MIIERHEKTKYEPYKDRGGIADYEKSIHECYVAGVVAFGHDAAVDGACCHGLTG